MNFINFWFFKQIFYSIKKLFKHKFLWLIIFGIIIYFLIQSKCFAVEFDFGSSHYNMTVENPPASILNYLINNTSYNPEVHDFVIWRNSKYSDTTSNYGYLCIYFERDNIIKMSFKTIRGNNSIDFVFNNSSHPAVPPTRIIRGLRFNHNGTYTGTGEYNENNYQNMYMKTRSGNNFSIEFLSSIPMYLSQSSDNVLIKSYRRTYAPFIVNDSENISNLSFAPNSNLLINTNGMIIRPNLNNFFINYSYGDYDYSFNINQYLLIDDTTSPRTFYFNIPKFEILKNIIVRPNTSITFTLTCSPDFEDVDTWDLGTYALSITQEQADIINANTAQQITNNNTTINQQNANNLQNINDSINNSDVEFSDNSLPTDNTEDITAEGINGIFTSIYNAFCTGSAQDIVFPIPFTGKEITLSPNYVREMLNSSNANWVINFIEVFWWYIISRFIIKDISKKITKIKSGNIENIENNNIKEDML